MGFISFGGLYLCLEGLSPLKPMPGCVPDFKPAKGFERNPLAKFSEPKFSILKIAKFGESNLAPYKFPVRDSQEISNFMRILLLIIIVIHIVTITFTIIIHL